MEWLLGAGTASAPSRSLTIMSRAEETCDPRPWRNWYKFAAWERRRQALFAEQPLCVMCLRREEIVEATVADHVIPHRGDPELFWRGELQPLCASCHSGAKQREEAGLLALGLDADGWPEWREGR